MVKSLNLYTEDNPSNRLKKIKHQMVDGVWLGMVVVAMVGAPLSISRYLITGWMSIYAFSPGDGAILHHGIFLSRENFTTH